MAFAGEPGRIHYAYARPHRLLERVDFVLNLLLAGVEVSTRDGPGKADPFDLATLDEVMEEPFQGQGVSPPIVHSPHQVDHWTCAQRR